MIDLRHPTDPALTAQMVESVTALNSDLGLLQDYEKAHRLARKAPNSGLAQMSFAFQTAFALELIPRAERAEALAAARKASDRAVELIPEFGDVYIPWCLLRSDQRMIECENRLRGAMRTDPDAPFVNAFLSNLLNQVGRNREASEMASLSLAHDRFMFPKIARRLRTLQVTGEVEKAEELYRQSTRWWPGNEQISWNYMSGMAMRGDFEAVQRFQREREGTNQRPDATVPALASAVKTNSVDAARKACSRAQDIDALLCMLALARLGDLDAAYRFAGQLYPSRRGSTPAEEERIWLYSSNLYPIAFLTAPAAAPLRRDPRYLALAERVGLLEYWRSGRLPDFCTVDHEPICKQIGRGA
jgi:tetratricopeptide (TPR) repeat protein